jgi:hypothetical protein
MSKIILTLLLLTSIASYAKDGANDPSNYGRCEGNDALSLARLADPNNAAVLKLTLGIGRPCNLPIVKRYVLAHPPQFSDAQMQSLAQQLLTYVEQARQDKQVGATDSSTGTTSLVSKGVGAILGVALESGSIDRTTNGNVTTLTLNAARGIDFLSAGNIQPCAVIESNCSFARKLITGLTAATTFDIAQANTSTNSTAAEEALSTLVGSNSPAFTGVAARFDFHARKKDVQLTQLVTAYQASDYLAVTATYASAFDSLISTVGSDPNYQAALTDTLSELQNRNAIRTEADVDVALLQFVQKIAAIIDSSAPATAAFQAYASAENNYRGARDKALSAVLNKWTGSVEYNFIRLSNQPDESDFRAIYSYRSDTCDDRILQVTANAGAALYNSLLGSSTSRVRSAQAAFQLDYTATSTASKVQTVVSGGYYFQYMVANGLLTLPASQLAPGTAIPLPGDASELLNTTGAIHVGQGKVTLNIKGTSINIPLALTFSNRTDLVKASKVGGNFGITYDFSSLFAKLE